MRLDPVADQPTHKGIRLAHRHHPIRAGRTPHPGMTSFVATDTRVVSRGCKPVDVRFCGSSPSYYLCQASDCMLHDLPGFVYVVPIQRIRLP